jgi:hypothetical protein
MAYANRKNAWKDELWNVSLLPTVQVAQDNDPPRGPCPGGGKALEQPAVLSLREDTTLTPLAEAA